MIQPGRYRHFKGAMYDVLFIARDADTLKAMVVYESVITPMIYVRPLAEFEEEAVEGTPRFEYVGPTPKE